jgi:hypothetical protein
MIFAGSPQWVDHRSFIAALLRATQYRPLPCGLQGKEPGGRSA